MTKQAIAWFDGFTAACANMGVDPRKLLQKQAQQKAPAKAPAKPAAPAAPAAPAPAYPNREHDLDGEWYPRSSGVLKRERRGDDAANKRLAETLTPAEFSAWALIKRILAGKHAQRFDTGSIDQAPASLHYEALRDPRLMAPIGQMTPAGTNLVDRVLANYQTDATPAQVWPGIDAVMGVGEGYNGRNIAVPPEFIHRPDPPPARAGTGK